MLSHNAINDHEVRTRIRDGSILLGGNAKLKIFGLLSCKSGKRLKRSNRVFFGSIEDAFENGYRPCGHCMSPLYTVWKERQARAGRVVNCVAP